jgi:tetratricopeptide (TPR) repeat protein
VTAIADQLGEFVKALAAEDWPGKRRALDTIQAHPLTLAEWRMVKSVLEKHEHLQELENITKSFIAACAPTSVEPYLALACLLNGEAGYQVILKYLTEIGDLPANRAHIGAGLFKIMQYQACLEFTGSALKQDPSNCVFLILEARCLWHLGRRREARRKLLAVKKLLGANISFWIMFVTVAWQEFRETHLARTTAAELVTLLESRAIAVPTLAIGVFINMGLTNYSQQFIRNARPEDYHEFADLMFFFDNALGSGLHEAAVRFGRRIMEIAPDPRVEAKLKQIPSHLATLRGLNISR